MTPETPRGYARAPPATAEQTSRNGEVVADRRTRSHPAQQLHASGLKKVQPRRPTQAFNHLS
jgi:hypothetical protein